MSRYKYRESKLTVLFWETTFKKLYKKHYKDVVWYDGTSNDVVNKQDVSVVLIEGGVRRFQIKTKYYDDGYFDLNVWQGHDYAMNDYPIDFIGFGLINEGKSLVIRYSDYKDFWNGFLCEVEPKEGKDYIQFSISDAVSFGIKVWVTELGNRWKLQ